MQVLPTSPLFPSLIHQQFLARGLMPLSQTNPATPPSSEDNMSPPPTSDYRHDEDLDKQTAYDQTRARDFKCPLCSENMGSLKEFTSHLRGHNEAKPTNDPSDPTGQTKVYNCCLCGKMLSSFSSLDRHMLVHSGERPFSCEVCGQTFTTNGNMHRHRRTHNVRDSCESDGSAGSGGKRARKRKAASLPTLAENVQNKMNIEEGKYSPLKCPICSEKFFMEGPLELHMLSLHPGREIKCEECGHPCPTYNYFKLHRNMFHFKSSLMNLGLPAPGLPAPYTASLQLLIDHQDQGGRQQPPLLFPNAFTSVKKEEEVRENLSSSTLDLHNSSFCSETLQDDDPVLKEMKLKGEFPCRLCPAVFPNLRALKGHNKEHLIHPPFQCNVGTCTYSTSDKSNLLQHMRGHTGQKPFECKICNFGFTTKANCERHVKNKHNKSNKDDLRDHIIIHEGDEESNAGDKESMRGYVNSAYEPEPAANGGLIFPPTPPRSSAFIPYRPFEVVDRDIVDSDVEVSGDAPLDLSRKQSEESRIPPNDLTIDAKEKLGPQSLSEKLEPSGLPFPHPGFPFNLPFLQGSPAASSMWPAQFGLNPSPFHLHLAAIIAAKNEELKKHAESMQTKEPATNGIQSLGQVHDLSSPHHPHHHHLLSQISPTNSSLSTVSPQSSPCKPSLESSTDSSYKMIIKNGVLMRKQKQRRYRTERPYGCDQCKARFTLRSNMDRHMKQQHPEVYYQKPRPGPGRKPANQAETVDAGTGQGQIFVKKDLIPPRQEMLKSTYESEDEEDGFLEEEEDDEQTLIIDDDKRPDAQTFRGISQFFSDDNHVKPDAEAESESSLCDEKKKSAYSAAPQRMSCPYCERKFPWASSLERHILTHTGQKPFKCTECPLWFTTKSNCDRHILRKHGNNNNDKDDDVEGEEEEGFHLPLGKEGFPLGIEKLRRDSAGSDSPYKCHICDDGFADRSVAINHIEESHPEEFAVLSSKGAFDCAAAEDVSCHLQQPPSESGEELYDQLRGKFPDYTNRKVICLFCSRKFWSAEDLRRHVRTHTGERPYSCDICNRRFTLKHSMLRHKKKHDSGVSSNGEASEEDDTVSEHSSSEDGSTPEIQSAGQPGEDYDKKRANLMEKINRLNSSTDCL